MEEWKVARRLRYENASNEDLARCVKDAHLHLAMCCLGGVEDVEPHITGEAHFPIVAEYDRMAERINALGRDAQVAWIMNYFDEFNK